MRNFKRWIAALLSVVLLVALIPGKSMTVDAATNGVQEKLDKLRGVYYTGTYFTASGNAAYYTNTSESHINNIPARGGLPAGNTMGLDGTSCWAFAQYCFVYIYGSNFYTASVVSKPSFGDAIAVNGGAHYAIYLGEDANNYYVYDANYDYHCAVRYNGTLSKSSFYISTVYHATNYDKVYGTTQPSVQYTSITAGDYYLKNNSTGKYLAVDGGIDADQRNISVASFTGGGEMKLAISAKSQGYIMRPHCATRIVNPYGTTVSSGLNVNLWPDVNDSTQWWGFQKVSGGYVIRNMENQNCVLDISGTNVIVSTYTGAASQIWSLEPVACSHSYTSTVTKSATCTTNGVRTYTCTKCGDTYTSSIAATGHSYSSRVTAPTCTSQGYTIYTCTKCGNYYKDSYKSATGHYYVNGACT